jgi:hypothetical protein
LRREELLQIVDIQLQRVEKRLQQQQLTLELDKQAKTLIAKEGLRSAIRRASAQALDSGEPARSARDAIARRRVQTRRSHQGDGGGWGIDFSEGVKEGRLFSRSREFSKSRRLESRRSESPSVLQRARLD